MAIFQLVKKAGNCMDYFISLKIRVALPTAAINKTNVLKLNLEILLEMNKCKINCIHWVNIKNNTSFNIRDVI